MTNKTIIKIRRGVNGFKYAACDKDGYFLCNMNKLSDARKYWEKDIKYGNVELVRELDKIADMSHFDATINAVKHLLKAYFKK